MFAVNDPARQLLAVPATPDCYSQRSGGQVGLIT